MKRRSKNTRPTFLFLVVFLFLVPPSLSGINIRIISEMTHTQEVFPGETYETQIFIRNFSDLETRIKVYQRDYSYNCDGDQYYYSAGTLERSNASWIIFDPQQSVIPPDETTGIKCVVQVPEDPTLVGTYWSLIMVEPVQEDSKKTEEILPEEVNSEISPALRYAIQVITHIKETGTFQLEFMGTELLMVEKKSFLHVDVKNIGQRWLRPVLYVEIYDENGKFVGKYEGGKWRIYPGTSVRYRVDVTHVPRGVYKAMIIVDNLDEHIFGTEFILNLITSSL
jgi:hypothetical protein